MRSTTGRRHPGACDAALPPCCGCSTLIGGCPPPGRGASSRRGKGRAGSATRPAFGGGRRGPVGLHTAAIVALRCGRQPSPGTGVAAGPAVAPAPPPRLGHPDRHLLLVVHPGRRHHHQSAWHRPHSGAQGVARRGSALACAAGEEPGAGRDRRTADSCCGDGHDVVARNTRTACGDDSQRRGADCVLARGRKPGVGVVSCRRRATDPSLGATPRPSRARSGGLPTWCCRTPCTMSPTPPVASSTTSSGVRFRRSSLRYWAARVAVSSTSASRRPSGVLRPLWRCCSSRGARPSDRGDTEPA